jgi:hypothetical protein
MPLTSNTEASPGTTTRTWLPDLYETTMMSPFSFDAAMCGPSMRPKPSSWSATTEKSRSNQLRVQWSRRLVERYEGRSARPPFTLEPMPSRS